MAKRAKRLVKGIESLKKEIEEHFVKIENDILEGRIERGIYYVKETDRSLLNALELKNRILGKKDNSVAVYRKRLEKLRKSIEEL